MAEERIFKKAAIGGFDKDDVMEYIAVLKEKEARKNARISALETEIDKLARIGQKATDALQMMKDENEQLKKENANMTVQLSKAKSELDEAKKNHSSELEKVRNEYKDINKNLSEKTYDDKKLSTDIGSAVVDARRFTDIILDEAGEKINDIASHSDLAAQSMIDDLSAVSELLMSYSDRITNAFKKMIDDNEKITSELNEFKGSLVEPIEKIKDDFYVKKPILSVKVDEILNATDNVDNNEEPLVEENISEEIEEKDAQQENNTQENVADKSTQAVEKQENLSVENNVDVVSTREKTVEPTVEENFEVAEKSDEPIVEDKADEEIIVEPQTETNAQPIPTVPKTLENDEKSEEQYDEPHTVESNTEKAPTDVKPSIAPKREEKPTENHRYEKVKSGTVQVNPAETEQKVKQDVAKMFEEAMNRRNNQQENAETSKSSKAHRYGRIG